MKNKNICMISCTLPIDDKMVKVWNELANALDKNDYKLLMLVTSVHPDMNFDYVQIPFTLDEFDQLQIEIKDTHYNDENLTALEMTEREIEWFGKNRNDWWNHYRGYFKCKSFYRSFIQSVKPSLIIAWQNSLPQSNILKRLAEEYSIPNLIMERGMLPDSFMLEKSGNVALSDIVNNFSIRKVIKDSTAKNDYDKIKEFYRTNKPTKYSQRSLNESQILLDEFNLKEIPTLVYFANMDSSVGLYPYGSNLSKKTSVEFNNTKKVINSLLSYAKKHSLNIFVKLHPHDNNDYSEYELEEIRILRDFDYHLLMEKADLLAFSSTTLQFESLIYEKPVILFNNSELCGFNIGYEVQSLQNLFKVITEAVNKDQLETRLDNAKRFLHWAANYFLFSYYENTPIKNNLLDMADYFAEIGINDNSLNFEKKLNRLEKFLKSLKYKNTVSLKLDSGIIECENDNTVIGEYEDDLEELKILMEKLESGELIPELFEQSGKIFSRYDEKITADKYFDHSTILRERIRSKKEEEDSLINNSYEFIKHEYDGYVTAKNYFDAYLLIESKLRINSSDPKLNSLQTELIEIISKRKKEKKWDVNKSVKALQNADKYFNSNNLKDAKNKLLEVLNLEPLHIEAINNLAIASLALEKEDKALELVKYVLQIDPENESAKETQKFILDNSLLKKLNHNSEENILINNQCNPKSELDDKLIDLTELNNLAMIDIKNGKYKEARQKIISVIIEDPLNEVARNDLRYLHENFEEKLFDNLIEDHKNNKNNYGLKIECPLCSSDSYYILSKNNHQYYGCSSCEAIFTPYIDSNTLITSNQGDKGRHFDDLNNLRLERILKYRNNKIESCIDFGCGNGQFVKFMINKGYNCIGIDQGTNIQLKDIQNENIDCISMIEVIEHINYPAEIFNHFNRILKEKGIVYIESSFISKQNLQEWKYLNPEIGHSIVYSYKSISLLAARHGFEIQKINDNVYVFIKNNEKYNG